MSIAVRKSPLVLIKPSEKLATTGNIKLNPDEMMLMEFQIPVLLVFERPIHQTVETIKRALSQALVQYYHISGRISTGANNEEFQIECTGEGVAFVAAFANCALKEAEFFDRSTHCATTLLSELIVYYPPEVCGRNDPLLFMQVTEFTCGGFIIGVSWNHAIGDAAGISQFLQAVGELARGLSSPSVVPVRGDDSIPSLHPTIIGLLSNLEPLDLVFLDITITSSSISRIKDEFRVHSDGQMCTTVEVVMAMLWQCRTRAINSSPDAPTLLLFAANARKQMGAKDGYYGNSTSLHFVRATCSTVANGDIIDLVKMIKDAKDKLLHKFKKNNGYQQLRMTGQQQLYHLQYNSLLVSSVQHLGFDKADFGGGKPVRIMCYGKRMLPLPFCTPCLPWKGKDAANVFAGCVKEEHAPAFLGELARFMHSRINGRL
ncbi:hypothetical protein ACP70R_012096 [Stipagrostis hirtigluma subsp. patula]